MTDIILYFRKKERRKLLRGDARGSIGLKGLTKSALPRLRFGRPKTAPTGSDPASLARFGPDGRIGSLSLRRHCSAVAGCHPVLLIMGGLFPPG
jgi:hypothetical protein